MARFARTIRLRTNATAAEELKNLPAVEEDDDEEE
jgi:hypothetical protein